MKHTHIPQLGSFAALVSAVFCLLLSACASDRVLRTPDVSAAIRAELPDGRRLVGERDPGHLLPEVSSRIKSAEEAEAAAAATAKSAEQQSWGGHIIEPVGPIIAKSVRDALTKPRDITSFFKPAGSPADGAAQLPAKRPADLPGVAPSSKAGKSAAHMSSGPFAAAAAAAAVKKAPTICPVCGRPLAGSDADVHRHVNDCLENSVIVAE
jgi:hypothetical protein